jgi:hypothetical protein
VAEAEKMQVKFSKENPWESDFRKLKGHCFGKLWNQDREPSETAEKVVFFLRYSGLCIDFELYFLQIVHTAYPADKKGIGNISYTFRLWYSIIGFRLPR